jgi:hypothetical protein
MSIQYTYEQLKSNWTNWIVTYVSSLPIWLLIQTKFKATNDLLGYGCHQPRSNVAFTPLEPNLKVLMTLPSTYIV